MKDDRILESEVRAALDDCLSGVDGMPSLRYDIMRSVRGETKVKKKLSIGLVFVIVLMLAAVTALALGLQRSAEVDALGRAREALMAEYNLTQASIGCFETNAGREGDTWTVTFTGTAMYPERLGTYTVQLRPGASPQASWTHDDVDPSLWQGGNMDAPVWGQKQIMERLQMNGKRVEGYSPTWDSQPVNDFPENLPGEDDISFEEAWAIGREAIITEMPDAEKALEAGAISGLYYTKNPEVPVWAFTVYFIHNHIEITYHMEIDAKTGEILLLQIDTGGNG
jgi:hypothetical protein